MLLDGKYNTPPPPPTNEIVAQACVICHKTSLVNPRKIYLILFTLVNHSKLEISPVIPGPEKGQPRQNCNLIFLKGICFGKPPRNTYQV